MPEEKEKTKKNTDVRVNVVHHYRERVAKAKKVLPKNWKRIVIERYPEYDTAKNSRLIDYVSVGRTADLRLTHILEKLAKEYNAEVNKEN